MAALDLLGRRHALRTLWELRQGPLRFRELALSCGDVSPSVLNARLRELRESGLIELDAGSGYRLSAHGAELCGVLAPLTRWSEGWARRLAGPRRKAGGRARPDR